MNIADWIALGIILLLLICAVRYMLISRKKNGCCGSCSACNVCKERSKCSENKNT